MNSFISEHNWAKIIDIITNYRISSIIAPTGTGKTLGIPLAFAAKFKELGRNDVRIYVVLPTVFAVQLAYQEQMKLQENIGKYRVNVGYAAEREKVDMQYANIIYITSGLFLKMLFADINRGHGKTTHFADAVMLDEIHIGSLDYQTIMSLWQTLLANVWTSATSSRLILASAISDRNLLTPLYERGREIPSFNLYSNGNEQSNMSNVIIEYTNERDETLHLPSRYINAANIIWEYHLQENLLGNFLVFLPGKNQIKLVHRKLKEFMVDRTKTPMIIEAFGGMPVENRKAILDVNTDKDAKRKIILATNVAETSITIPGVTLVLDTMVENVARSRNTSGIQLTREFISKASAQQRAGRAGRTTDHGVCIRMCTVSKYNNLNATRDEESMRLPLHRTLLNYFKYELDTKLDAAKVDMYSHLAKAKRDVRNIATMVLADVSTKRIVEKISTSISNLYRRQIIVQRGTRLAASDLGYFVSLLDLSIDNSTILWHLMSSSELSSHYPIVCLVSLIDCYSDSNIQGFWQPDQGSSVRNTNYSMFDGENDIHVLLNIWRIWMDYWRTKDRPSKYKKDLMKWCGDNRINSRKMISTWNHIKNVIYKLRFYNESVNYQGQKKTKAGASQESKWPGLNLEFNSWSNNDSVKLLLSFKNILIEHYSDRMLIISDKPQRENRFANRYNNPTKKQTIFVDIYNHDYSVSTDKSIVKYSGDNTPNVVFSLSDLQLSHNGIIRNTVLLGFIYYEPNLPSRKKPTANNDFALLMDLLNSGTQAASSSSSTNTITNSTTNTLPETRNVSTQVLKPKTAPIQFTEEVINLDEYDIPAFLLDDQISKMNSLEISTNASKNMELSVLTTGNARSIDFVSFASQGPLNINIEEYKQGVTNVNPISDSSNNSSNNSFNTDSSNNSSNNSFNNSFNTVSQKADTVYDKISNENIALSLHNVERCLMVLKSAKNNIDEIWTSIYKLLRWRDLVVEKAKQNNIHLLKNKWYNILGRSVIDFFFKSPKGSKKDGSKDFWNKLISEYDKQTRPQKNQGRLLLLESWTEIESMNIPVRSPLVIDSDTMIMEPYRMRIAPGMYQNLQNLQNLQNDKSSDLDLIRLWARYILLVPYNSFWYHNTDIDKYLGDYFDHIHQRFSTPFTFDSGDDAEYISYQSLFKQDKTFGAKKLDKSNIGNNITVTIAPRTEKIIHLLLKSITKAPGINLWIFPHWSSMKRLQNLSGMSIKNAKMLNLTNSVVVNDENYWIMLTGSMNEKTRNDHLNNIKTILENKGKINPVYGHNLVSSTFQTTKYQQSENRTNAVSPRKNTNVSEISSPRFSLLFNQGQNINPIQRSTIDQRYVQEQISLPMNYLSAIPRKRINTRRLFALQM